jgi:nucleoside-diphosphate-sugar epimerase
VTEKALGWRAEVSLFEGLGRTARWYGQAGWLSVKSR